MRRVAPRFMQRFLLEGLRRVSLSLSQADTAPWLSVCVLRLATLIGGTRGRDWWRMYCDFYRQPECILDCYLHWLVYCEELAPKPRHNLIVEYEDALRIYSHTEWKRATRDAA